MKVVVLLIYCIDLIGAHYIWFVCATPWRKNEKRMLCNPFTLKIPTCPPMFSSLLLYVVIVLVPKFCSRMYRWLLLIIELEIERKTLFWCFTPRMKNLSKWLGWKWMRVNVDWHTNRWMETVPKDEIRLKAFESFCKGDDEWVMDVDVVWWDTQTIKMCERSGKWIESRWLGCLLGGGSDNTLLAMIADALLFLWLLSEKFVFIAVTKIKIAWRCKNGAEIQAEGTALAGHVKIVWSGGWSRCVHKCYSLVGVLEWNCFGCKEWSAGTLKRASISLFESRPIDFPDPFKRKCDKNGMSWHVKKKVNVTERSAHENWKNFWDWAKCSEQPTTQQRSTTIKDKSNNDLWKTE